jgi:hypothetical protein
MKYLAVYTFEKGMGSVNVMFKHSPPTIKDIRDAEVEIQKINKFVRRPVIINWLKISDDLEDVKTDNEQIPTGGWIPVSERLPEEKGDYLVTTGFCDVGWSSVDIGTFDGEGFVTHINVDAWMPLPEPYKAE